MMCLHKERESHQQTTPPPPPPPPHNRQEAIASNQQRTTTITMTHSMQKATNLLYSVLTKPSNVATALDWRQMGNATILTMTLHSDSIGLAVAPHPSQSIGPGRFNGFRPPLHETHAPVRTLPSIPLAGRKRTKVTAEGLNELRAVMDQNQVCGVVLSWPMQRDTARMGASCGRALHVLDQIMLSQDGAGADQNQPQASNPMMFSQQERPICLWTPPSIEHEGNKTDRWGRSPIYAGTDSKKTIHSAKTEQYHQHDSVVAQDVWESFCQMQWPQYSELMTAAKEEQQLHEQVETAAAVADSAQQQQPEQAAEQGPWEYDGDDYSYDERMAF